MIRTIVVLAAMAALAGCGSSDAPSVDGKDALGLPIYTLSGPDLSRLELTANSSCPGGSRPYYRDFKGGGDGTTLTYTCE